MRQHAKGITQKGNLEKGHHIWWDHPRIDGNFPLLLTLHEEAVKPVRHLAKDVRISEVNRLRFPAGKKCNCCQFRFGLVVIFESGHA